MNALPHTERLTDTERVLYWINNEIPAYLRKFANFAEFDKAMPAAAASVRWKEFAYAMAKERWGVQKIERIPA